MTELKEGQMAQDFELLDSDGKKTRLSSFRGKKVLVYFYPKDDTPGCTKQACDIRDNFSALKKKGVVVLGISNDDSKSHRKFADKFSLPFTLLADTEKDVSEKYGVYQLKKFMGKEYMGIVRSSFLIDEKGKIMKAMYKVNPDDHYKDVMEILK
jgi:thioredoxin-dependent peroxiredoxin